MLQISNVNEVKADWNYQEPTEYEILTISSLRLLLFPVLQRKIDRVFRYNDRKGRKGDSGNRKRRNNSLPPPRSEAMKLRQRPAMRTGSGASRAHGRSSPMIREDAAPPCLSGSPVDSLRPNPFDFFGRINTFDESFRANRQTRRHGFNLRADSNRFPQAQPRCVHTSADLCTRTRPRSCKS